MAPKEPTRHQLSSRLAYSQTTPSFLQKLKNQVAGVTDDVDEEAEFDDWQASSGRPPIPRRPSPPQRPDDNPGSADEEDDDEKPQVVVLKKGKHMTEIEVENEKRKAKGLPSLPNRSEDGEPEAGGTKGKLPQTKPAADVKESKSASLSFSSSGGSSKHSSSTKKRKAIGEAEADDLKQLAGQGKPEKKTKKTKTKKNGALLSFGDGNDG